MTPGRKKGTLKTGGRQKGTPNKRTLIFSSALERKGFDCAKEWLDLYDEIKLDPKLIAFRIDALKQIAMYVYPKPKEIDLSKNQETENEKQVDSLPKETLLSVIQPDAQSSNIERTGS